MAESSNKNGPHLLTVFIRINIAEQTKTGEIFNLTNTPKDIILPVYCTNREEAEKKMPELVEVIKEGIKLWDTK